MDNLWKRGLVAFGSNLLIDLLVNEKKLTLADIAVHKIEVAGSFGIIDVTDFEWHIGVVVDPISHLPWEIQKRDRHF